MKEIEKTTFIYALIDPRYDSVRYIGKSNNPIQRYQNHYNSARDKNTHKRNWINNVRDSGHRPEIFILDEVYISEWKFWEKFYISLYKTFGFKLTNYTDGGDGGDGATFANSGSFKKGHIPHNIGIPCSEETKKKISNTLKLKNIKPPNRRKIIQYDFNYNKINEYNSMSDACLGDSIFIVSKISACCKFKRNSHGGFIWRFIENDKKIKYVSQKRSVIKYDLNMNIISEYDSISEASKKNNIKPPNISTCCRLITKTSGGFIWRYKKRI